MRKVTTINLNNNAYQIDEEGYDALRDYLSAAERNLEGNPDRAEILADLEQAIGDKCRACLGAHKTVVNAEDIRRILLEMGPVEPTGAGGSAAGAAASGADAARAAGAAAFPRRLYRIEEGRMWAGVCTGLAAYFGVDVVWVRLMFILLTLFTGGIWIIVYIAMCFIVPVAETAEERAAAQGAPFNARELIDRVKKNSRDFRPRGRRMNRGTSWWAPRNVAPAPPGPGPAPGYAARITGGLLLPVFTVLSAAWFAGMLLATIAIWNAHGIFGYQQWSQGMPRWVVILALIALWSLIAMPIGAARRASVYYANGGRTHGWADAWSGLLWLALVCVTFVVAWQFVPGVQEAFRQLLHWAQFNTTYV